VSYSTYSNFCWQPDRRYDLSHTKLTSDRLYLLDAFSDRCKDLRGDFAECGVWQGGSAKVLLKGRPLHLYDTFTGMPKNDEPCYLPEGSFGDTSPGQVAEYLDSHLVRMHVGEIPQTFDDDLRFSFVHIDVDLYRTAYDCILYFLKRLVPGGMIIFDDYGFPDYQKAAKQAVDELIPDVIVLPTGQALHWRIK
jgi:O-methyltransferase